MATDPPSSVHVDAMVDTNPAAITVNNNEESKQSQYTNLTGPAEKPTSQETRQTNAACEERHGDNSNGAASMIVTNNSNGSLGSEGGISCRVCLDSAETTSKLVKPCVCSGSQMYIHFHCLKDWIHMSHENVCGVCKQEYKGVVMTVDRVPIGSFLRANPAVQGGLVFGIMAALITGYIVLIGFMTSSAAASSESIWFFFKFLLSYSNACFLFMYILCILMGCLALRGSYLKYAETHKTYTVTSFDANISMEVLEKERIVRDATPTPSLASQTSESTVVAAVN